MACQSDDESGIYRALAMSAAETTKDAPDSARMKEALKLRQKMNPSTKRSVPILSPRHASSSMFDDNEEEDDDEEVTAPVRNGVENDEPNVKSDLADVAGHGGNIKRDINKNGRKALFARLNLKNATPQKEEKGRITTSQFQNQLSSRFKTTKHQVRRLASSDNED